MGISQSALNRGRRAAVADMEDSCIAEAESGVEWNAEAMADVPAFTPVYEGRCEVRFSEQVLLTSSGAVVEGYVVKVPVEAAPLAIGNRITIRGAKRDPILSGRVFYVSKLAVGSHVISRRYQVKETSGPGG